MADIAKILERIRKLVALAASDNENEARNSAVLACRLIREHKIVLKISEDEPVRRRPNPFAGNPFGSPFGFDGDIWDAIFNGQQRRARERETCSCGRPKSPLAEVCPECMRRRNCPLCGRPRGLDGTCAPCENERRSVEADQERRRRAESDPVDREELSDSEFAILEKVVRGGPFWIRTQQDHDDVDRLFLLRYIETVADFGGIVHGQKVCVTPRGQCYFEERAAREEFERRTEGKRTNYSGRRRRDE